MVLLIEYLHKNLNNCQAEISKVLQHHSFSPNLFYIHDIKIRLKYLGNKTDKISFNHGHIVNVFIFL